MATYAVGDVQGCYDELVELLALIRFSADRDRLWFVGDVVNRGPESLEALRLVKSLDDNAVVVLGNHDFHLLRLAAGFGREHEGDTLARILHAPDRDALVEWLSRRPLAHREGRALLVHAGLVPEWSAERVLALAEEVHVLLREPGEARTRFLERLYGDHPDRWDDALTGAERLRVIVNVLARLRFCAPDGTMEFREKRGATFAPPGMRAWFLHPGRASADHLVICGHWSTQELTLTPNVWMLDSGCLWGGALTAVRIEDGCVFQVPSRLPVAPKPFG
jgi:bis(5'-nucleosyl)-tetraphosphatase (symmetrical)